MYIYIYIYIWILIFGLHIRVHRHTRIYFLQAHMKILDKQYTYQNVSIIFHTKYRETYTLKWQTYQSWISSLYIYIYIFWYRWQERDKLWNWYSWLFWNHIGRKLPESLQWLHNERKGVPNHQPHDCSLNRLFRRRSKKASKLRVTGIYVGNSPVTGDFPYKGLVTRIMFPFNDIIVYPHYQVIATQIKIKYTYIAR